MTPYHVLRTMHLVCGTFALPALLIYGVSAVQMAHPQWFRAKPSVTEITLPVAKAYADGRALALHIMTSRHIDGEMTEVHETPSGFDIRVALPGTVHAIHYERGTGTVRLRTSVNPVMGMLNRLHHAAGLWHEYLPLKLWAALCGLVSLATLGLGVSGIWMWWMRKQERAWGIVLLLANVVFALAIFGILRSAGP